MRLEQILSTKGRQVFTTTASATLDDVAQSLVRHRVGSLVVVDAAGRMVGIITERDILLACAERRGPLADLAVSDYMTTRMQTAAPSDSVEHTMGLMTENRIRHLPVIENGQLAGMISIGDVVKAQHAEMALENHLLKSYIQG